MLRCRMRQHRRGQGTRIRAGVRGAQGGRRVRLGCRLLLITGLCGAIQVTTSIKAVDASPVPDVASRCTSHQLVISLGTLSAALGHLALPIHFHDRGGTCSLRGFPRVDGLAATGGVIIHAKPTLKGYFGRWRIATITLRNGHMASALLEGLDPAFFSRRPRSARNLRITPPNVSQSVVRRTTYPLSDLTIHPIVARRNGGGE
jgi:hypothetical protein